MLEQLLDRLHCYPLAARIRSLKKTCSSPTETATQKEWIRKYNMEELIGVAILQCKNFVEEEKRILLLKEKEEEAPGEQKGSSSSARDGKLEEYETKLFKLRQEYWLHQQALQELVDKKPRGAWIREWNLMRYRKRHNMTLAWLEGSKACVLTGGCCGRACGCCEKPMRTYLAPSASRFNNKKKINNIYGHCNAQYCRCCVRSRGFSKPDPSFTEFVNNHYGR
ncbi:hypothetical protein VTN77DRAFT_6873 [Rasamsonia byssochlamydoides]|uniref:uncharacterized protein n=1 Tax=Rasamsonia byssochlamydoides TaxID=89139 RepID=UPI0037442AF3